MRNHRASSLFSRGLNVALLALALVLALAGWSADRAHADVNLNGNWNITLQTDDGPVFLPAIITQSGTSLTIDTGGIPLTGTIVPATGAFHVTGIFTEDLLGTASNNSMSGTWSVTMPQPASGPFTGQRKTSNLGGVAEYPDFGSSHREVLLGLAAGALALMGAATFALRRAVR